MVEKSQLVLVSSLLLFSFGCRVSKPIIIESSKSDSVYVKEILRDTVVHIEADSSLVRALIECDSMGRAYISQIVEMRDGENVSSPSLVINDNILTSTAIVDSMEIFMELKDKHSEHIVKEVVTHVVEVNCLTVWQKITCWVGGTSIVLLIGFFGRLSVGYLMRQLRK